MSAAHATPGDTDFDYVIVGGGSAGCVLAGRLSEDPNVRVCLIEAGPPDRHPLIHIPLGVTWLIKHPTLNWRYWSQPQQHVDGRKVFLPRGRVLGGSSSINGSIYIRGHRSDYDDWAAWGNSGWSYAEVLPYFRKSENNEQFRASPYHGVGGPLNVTDCDSYNPLTDMMLDAADSLQLPRTEDFNGREQEGFGRRQVTIRGGRRESAATAFLKDARQAQESHDHLRCAGVPRRVRRPTRGRRRDRAGGRAARGSMRGVRSSCPPVCSHRPRS